jgi:Zn-finger protein
LKYILLLILLFVIGCSTQTTTSNNDQNGSELYSEKCGGCHRLHSKNEYTKAEWSQILQTMKTKAKLTEKENSIIEQYLINP